METPVVRNQIARAAERFARSALEHDRTGHDWWHARRVAQMAERLAISEGADPFICVVAAWLHDIADEKLNESEESGRFKVSDWLNHQPLETESRQHVLEIVSTMSYRAGTGPPMRTLEGKVVQDADRLDAIGAIAIARTFVYAGWIGHPIHDPDMAPRESMSLQEYRQGKSTAINHFHEKLLRLKDRINTASAMRIAERRHRFMEHYLQQFMQEWEGTT